MQLIGLHKWQTLTVPITSHCAPPSTAPHRYEVSSSLGFTQDSSIPKFRWPPTHGIATCSRSRWKLLSDDCTHRVFLTEGRNMVRDTTATTSGATLLQVSCAYGRYSSNHNAATETAVISGTISTLPRGDSPEVAVPKDLYICEGENQ